MLSRMSVLVIDVSVGFWPLGEADRVSGCVATYRVSVGAVSFLGGLFLAVGLVWRGVGVLLILELFSRRGCGIRPPLMNVLTCIG